MWRSVTAKFPEWSDHSHERPLGRQNFKAMNGTNRADITPGIEVEIVLKQDQRSGKLTHGIVQNILTSSSFHPHGIKVRLTDGQVGRVKNIL